MTIRPIHVVFDMVSWNMNLPNNMLRLAKAATYTPSNLEKSHFTIFTTTP